MTQTETKPVIDQLWTTLSALAMDYGHTWDPKDWENAQRVLNLDRKSGYKRPPKYVRETVDRIAAVCDMDAAPYVRLYFSRQSIRKLVDFVRRCGA